MIKSILQDIGGIGAYGVISLCLFFAVFFGASILSLVLQSSFCERMSSLPLHEEKGEA